MEVTKLLDKMYGVRLAIIRDNEPVVIGKFSEWVLDTLLQPGDAIMYEDETPLCMKMVEV